MGNAYRELDAMNLNPLAVGASNGTGRMNRRLDYQRHILTE